MREGTMVAHFLQVYYPNARFLLTTLTAQCELRAQDQLNVPSEASTVHSTEGT